jgi:hypothetical protein
MRAFCLLPLVICLACATSAGSTPTPSTEGEPVDIPGVSGTLVRISVDRDPSLHKIAAPVRVSWASLAEVFDVFKIPLEFADVSAYRTGNTRFIAPRMIAGLPKSRYLRCGMGPAGQLADTHRVTMSIITELRPAGADSTAAFTQVVASARPNDGTGTEAVVCASTGLLESGIAQLLRTRVREKSSRGKEFLPLQ